MSLNTDRESSSDAQAVDIWDRLYKLQDDIEAQRDRPSQLLSVVEPQLFDSERIPDVLDLTPYVRKAKHIAGGAHGDVYQGAWINVPPIVSSARRLPQIAVKSIRVFAANANADEQRRRSETVGR